MRKPNVLVVQRVLPPYRLPFFQRLAKSSDFSLTMAYGDAVTSSALESLPQPDGLHIVQLHNIYVGGAERIVCQRGVLSLLRSGKYEVVIAEFNPRIISSVLACLYAKQRTVKWIWWGQGIGPSATAISVRVRLRLAQVADALIFYDDKQQERFVSLGVPQAKSFVARNSIETEGIDLLRQSRPRCERNYILYIGRLTKRKKVDSLIRGFQRVYPQLPPETQLILIGDGPERNALVQLVTQLALTERVQFLGALYDQKELAPWFNAAWASVSPGAIGLSAVHSLAYGVPLVVARSEPHGPEIGAMEDGTNGWFFTSDDGADLGQKLWTLSSNHQRWERMAKAACCTVQDCFSLGTMVRTFEGAVSYVHRT